MSGHFTKHISNTYFRKGGSNLVSKRYAPRQTYLSQEMGRNGFEPLRNEPSSALITVIFKLADNPVEYLDCQFSDVRTAD